jgi:hypothetical protein
MISDPFSKTEYIDPFCDPESIINNNDSERGSDRGNERGISSFDLEEFISKQLLFIEASQKSLIGSDGRIEEGSSLRDIQSVISAASSLFNLLMRYQNLVALQSRENKFESAVSSALSRIEDVREREAVIKLLEEELEKIEEA